MTDEELYKANCDEIKRDLWEDLNDGIISEDEWSMLMWANGFLPDDTYSDDDEDQNYSNDWF